MHFLVHVQVFDNNFFGETASPLVSYDVLFIPGTKERGADPVTIGTLRAVVLWGERL